MLLSPISTHHLGLNGLSIADQWLLSELYLQVGRLNQSLQVAYEIFQQDSLQQQRYFLHQQKVFRLGAEFAEEIGDYDSAAYYWSKVTQQQPNDAEAWYGLGIAQANQQHYQDAQQSLQRSLQLNPNDQKARSFLAEISVFTPGIPRR